MYKQITVETTSQGADFIAGIFFGLGVGGVVVDDPNDINEVLASKTHWDYVEESLLDTSGPVKVSCFVSCEEWKAKVEELKSRLAEISGVDMGSLNITVTDYVDCDWLDEWKKYFKPIKAGRFVVAPSWEEYEPKDGEIVIKIDPSMAFGTGEHESTRLCLKLMSELDIKGKQVIDVGTGSGVLGIAAIKAEAGHCYMCDIDSLAVKSATDNARLNDVIQSVTIEESDLLTKTGLKADILLANLTADIISRLAEAGLTAHIKDGGFMVCSGIINKRKGEVIKALKDKGLTLIKECGEGDWVGLLLKL